MGFTTICHGRVVAIAGCAMLRCTLFVAAFVIMVTGLCVPSSSVGAEPGGISRPNIVLIMADDKYNAAEREPSKCREFGTNCGVFGDSHIASNPVKFSGIGVN